MNAPLGIAGNGVDLVEIVRIKGALERHGDAFLSRVFTSGERAYALSRARPEEHLAARFAAKEAVLKLLGTGWAEGLAFCEVEVMRTEGGAPAIRLHGRAAAAAGARGIGHIHVSLSHAGGMAVAFVVGECADPAT